MSMERNKEMGGGRGQRGGTKRARYRVVGKNRKREELQSEGDKEIGNGGKARETGRVRGQQRGRGTGRKGNRKCYRRDGDRVQAKQSKSKQDT